MKLSSNEEMVVISCYKSEVHFVDVKNRSKPKLLYSFDPEIGIVCGICFSPVKDYVLMGGTSSSQLILYDLN
jgi:hypothetical protein